MKPTIKTLEDKIAALEKRIAELEARPASQFHNHYHYDSTPAPLSPSISPSFPQPGMPWWGTPPTCGAGNIGPDRINAIMLSDQTPTITNLSHFTN